VRGILATGLGLLLACGCIETGTVQYQLTVPEDQGQRTDSTSVPGKHDGYEVLGVCQPSTQYRLGLRGLGSRRIVRRVADGWDDPMLALRLRAEKALGSTAHAVWYQPSTCHETHYALTAFVATYGEVDAALASLGALLRDEGLGDYAAIALLRPDREGRTTFEHEVRMPLARRPFFPYELALTAGARYEDAWHSAFALHLGVAFGREQEPPSKVGWFWGLGVDGRVVLRSADTRWSAGPNMRFGTAFGMLEPDTPSPGTARGTYLYGQLGAEWSTSGPLVVTSLGFTSLAVAELSLRRYNQTGNHTHLLLLPLALLNHVEIASEVDATSATHANVAILFGFSL
jgi:hypothetical protein